MSYRDRDDSVRDRDKKSFSELDQARREKKYRGDDRESSGQMGPQQGRAYSNYKRELNKVFDGGGLPEALKDKLGETEVGAKSKARKAALEAVKKAATPKKILAAFTAFREEHGFPDDAETLAKLLELETEPEIVVEALGVIAQLADEGTLKKTGSLKMRVKTVKMTIDDDEVFAAAGALLKKL